MKAWRIGWAALALGTTIGGCAPEPPAPSPAPALVSYDGTYHGTVTVTGAGAGVQISLCATDPRLTLQVRDSAFTYTQSFPKVIGGSVPGGNIANMRMVYTARITPNGNFNGQSEAAGTIMGVISGSHMSGTIEGAECVYSFAADRS